MVLAHQDYNLKHLKTLAKKPIAGDIVLRL